MQLPRVTEAEFISRARMVFIRRTVEGMVATPVFTPAMSWILEG